MRVCFSSVHTQPQQPYSPDRAAVRPTSDRRGQIRSAPPALAAVCGAVSVAECTLRFTGPGAPTCTRSCHYTVHRQAKQRRKCQREKYAHAHTKTFALLRLRRPGRHPAYCVPAHTHTHKHDTKHGTGALSAWNSRAPLPPRRRRRRHRRRCQRNRVERRTSVCNATE